MFIQLSAEIYKQMEVLFNAGFPNEECALLLGTPLINQSFHIHSLVPAKNIASDPLHHFELDPATWVHHLMTSPDLVGLFHTHPSSAPLPSATDLHALQSYGELIQIYLIAGFTLDSNTMELKAYEVTKQDRGFGLRPATLRMT
ncbi:Mov34/MPN/PAD-1 family protein [Paenibacillus sp. Marseille-Q4541]|uniref:Mov34/MPN/PAD-1 family protein n=1 Tax=Paenibacillus sp. Marseille-Q4541 TaxID=2831522 RepID=UPI001BAB4ACE|nr:Mov34/MPN/PAD-1 family protein [Paenibacillus sp. Marseille-Q4541]